MSAVQLAAGPCVLWANQEVLNGLSRRFQSGGAEVSVLHIVVLAVLVLVAAAVWWAVGHVGAQREGHSYHSARRLFGELCVLHELDWPSRRLLRQLARAHDLAHPARVFVEPSWFDAPQLPADLETQRPQLAALKQRLF
ncbi:MAG: hypothetical protein MUF48_12805 [Pirellulaceae bacterium]|jgi:hypothetical protein|nr:hypothetical protein [Pirellulaceae bacterium]